jgi:hypothetical protein
MKNYRVTILLISTLLLFVGFVAVRVVSNKEKTKAEVEAELNKYIISNNPDYEGAEFFLDQELRENSNISNDKELKGKLGRIREIIELNKVTAVN